MTHSLADIAQYLTQSEWGTTNPILWNGYVGVESDTGRVKIGDGASHWRDLVYFASGVGSIGSIITHSHVVGDIVGFGSGVRSTPLSGLTTGAISHISPSDTILSALASLQAQVSAVAPSDPLSRSGDWAAGHLINGRLSVSASAGNLTVAIKTAAGANPSVSDPVYARIGDTIRSITTPLSKTLPAGTNWFNLGSAELAGKDVDLFAYLFYYTTAGTPKVDLAFGRLPSVATYADTNSGLSTNERAVVYNFDTAQPDASDRFELVGRFNATLSAGGSYSWSIPATQIVVNKPLRETRWLDCATALTPDASMTATSVSVAHARYKITGDTLSFKSSVSFTAGGTLAGTFYQTLPLGRTLSSSDDLAGFGYARDSADIMPAVLFDGSQTARIKIVKPSGNYTAGTVTAKIQAAYAV